MNVQLKWTQFVVRPAITQLGLSYVDVLRAMYYVLTEEHVKRLELRQLYCLPTELISDRYT